MDKQKIGKNEISNDYSEVFKIINGLSEELIFLLWARKEPKRKIIDYYMGFARKLKLPLQIWVDDVTPKLLYNRTDEEQDHISNLYLEYFETINLVSKKLPEIEKMNLNGFLNLMSQTSFNDLKYILPKKKNNFDILKLDEFIHYAIQFEILSKLSINNPTFLIGKFSAGLYYLFNNSFTKINFIILNKVDVIADSELKKSISIGDGNKK